MHKTCFSVFIHIGRFKRTARVKKRYSESLAESFAYNPIRDSGETLAEREKSRQESCGESHQESLAETLSESLCETFGETFRAR